jgi:hypothetical protein
MVKGVAPQSVLAWVGQTLSRPSSRGDAVSELERRNEAESPGKKKGVLYLPAYFVRGDDGGSGCSQLSPSTSSTSSQAVGAASAGLGQWAASLVPALWRGPSPAPSHGSRRSRLSQDVDVESLGSQDDAGEDDAYFPQRTLPTAPPPYDGPDEAPSAAQIRKDQKQSV